MVRKSRAQDNRIRFSGDPTDGGRAEGQLHLLSRAVQQSPNLVLFTDASGSIEYVNRGFTATTGYSPEEVIGRHVGDLGELSPEVEKRLWETIASGGEWREEFQSRKKNGEILWVSGSISPIQSPDGVITHFLGCGEDVTKRKQAEEALRESEEKWRSLLEHIPDIVMTLDRDGTIQYINRTVPGYTADDVVGTKAYDYLPEEHHDRFADALERVFATGEVEQYEIAGAGPYGRASWYFNRIGPIWRDGRVVAATAVSTDIAERKRAEEALRQSETRFRTLAETTSAAIAVIQGEKFRYVNPATEAISGYTREELLAMDFWDLVHPDFREPNKERGFAQQRGESAPPRFEFKIVTKSGEQRWLDFTAGLTQFDGKPVVLGVAFDITERKRMEEALRESEERFRSAFDHAATGMALVAPDGRLLRVNRSCYEALGYSEQELISMTWQAITHPDDLDATVHHVRRVLAGEADSFQLEKRFVHKRGHVLWGHLTSSLVRDAEGRPLHFITQIQDITERKRAEEELRESERRYRDLVENISEAIFEVDVVGRITYISPVVEQVGGYTPSEITGRSFVEFVHPDDRARVIEGFEEILAGTLSPIEYRLLSKSGEARWVRAFSQPIHEEDRLVGFRGVLADITESKRTEEALRQSEEKYRLLADNVTDVIWTTDMNLRFTYISPSVTQLRGHSVEEAMAQKLGEVLTPASLKIAANTLAEEMAIEKMEHYDPFRPRTLELEQVRKDGSTVWTEVKMTFLRDRDNRPVGIQGVTRDVTERKRSEEALQQAKEQLESKVERRMQRGDAYGLTFRELTVLNLVAAGKPDKEIATLLAIRPRTANKHVENILAKMDASCRTEAGVRAVREGLLD